MWLLPRPLGLWELLLRDFPLGGGWSEEDAQVPGLFHFIASCDSPVHSTPLHSAPLHSTPLHSTPLHSRSVRPQVVNAAGCAEDSPRVLSEALVGRDRAFAAMTHAVVDAYSAAALRAEARRTHDLSRGGGCRRCRVQIGW